jgi:hypothetical protein
MLVGDSNRMVTVQGGASPNAGTSADGLARQPLPVVGHILDEQASQAALMPGGVLLSDGTTAWYGEALAR